MDDKNTLLRNLPKIDRVLERLQNEYIDTIPLAIIKSAVQQCIDVKRKQILSGVVTALPEDEAAWDALFATYINKKNSNNYKRVINGTGVVIHTNLGRSLLSGESIKAIQVAGECYTNLEFDLETGKRGSRYSLVEELICELTGAESAIVVNNNAAAVLLALNTLAYNKEAIVSRGQLVEIGGSFRIPDVMARSGARMVEVGATNRTHIYDYENALSEDTALLLKVHTSNFRLIGFTSEVSMEDLVSIGSQHGIPVMEDLGSGSLVDLSPFGLPKEPTVQEIVAEGADVVTFSGDKLLGGPQAGIIVGKKKIIDRIKKNPMNRALRIDKFTLATLETVLRNYYDLETAFKDVPTLRMLTSSQESLKKKGQSILRRIGGAKKNRDLVQLKQTMSKVGGGAMPEHTLPSWGLVLYPREGNAAALEKRLRSLAVPIVGRIEDERMVLDLRTILDMDIPLVVDILLELSAESVH